MFLKVIPLLQIAKSFTPTSIPMLSSVSFTFDNSLSTPTEIYQYFPSKLIRGFEYFTPKGIE